MTFRGIQIASDVYNTRFQFDHGVAEPAVIADSTYSNAQKIIMQNIGTYVQLTMYKIISFLETWFNFFISSCAYI